MRNCFQEGSRVCVWMEAGSRAEEGREGHMRPRVGAEGSDEFWLGMVDDEIKERVGFEVDGRGRGEACGFWRVFSYAPTR